MKSNLLILISLLTGSTLGYSIDNSLAKRGKEIEIDAETNNIHQHRNRGGKLVKRRRSGTEPEDGVHLEVENETNNIHQHRNRGGRIEKRSKTRNRNGSNDRVSDVGLFKRRRSGTEPEDSVHLEVENETNNIHQHRNRGGKLVKRRRSGTEPEDSVHLEVENETNNIHQHRNRGGHKHKQKGKKNKKNDDSTTTVSSPTTTATALPTSSII